MLWGLLGITLLLVVFIAYWFVMLLLLLLGLIFYSWALAIGYLTGDLYIGWVGAIFATGLTFWLYGLISNKS